jgi:hypothetical protein
MAQLPSGAVLAHSPLLKGGEGAAPGWGIISTPLPLGLVRPDRNRQARRCYAATVNEMLPLALIPTFWPVYLIPPNARQEGEPVICLSQSIKYRRDKPKVQTK